MSGVIKGTVSETKTLTGRASTLIAKDGESAYDIACRNGFEGTEAEWLESLNGVGASVDEIIEEIPKTIFTGLAAEWLHSVPSDGGEGFMVTHGGYEQTEADFEVAIAEFCGTQGDEKVILRNIGQGVNDHDAVNKAQMEAYVAENSGGGGSEVVTFEGRLYWDFDSEDYAGCELDCSFDDITNALQNGKTVRLVCDHDEVGEIRYFYFMNSCDGSWYDFACVYADHIETIRIEPSEEGTTCSIHLASIGGGSVELDTTLTEAGKAADAKAVGDKLGDIESALDHIIEIQNSLIGGEA